MFNLCKRKPYSWQTRRVKKSPFHTLNSAKKAEASFKQNKAVGFTAKSSLKSMGRIARSSGCFILGPKYR
jgi:hypothetical protein